MLMAWTPSTKKSYNCLIRRWVKYCETNNINQYDFTAKDYMEFIVDRRTRFGDTYNLLKSYKSALSMMLSNHVLTPKDNTILQVLMRGLFFHKPPIHKKQTQRTIWDVNVLLQSIKDLKNESLSLDMLTRKVAVLTMLTSTRRVGDIVLMDIDHCMEDTTGLIYHLQTPVKNFNPKTLPHKASLQTISIKAYPVNKNLCPVAAIKHYCSVTEKLRTTRKLFCTTTSPHRAATTPTIRRWLIDMLHRAGITGSTAHDFRKASASSSYWSGKSISQILHEGGWTNDTSFVRYYLKSVDNAKRPVRATTMIRRALINAGNKTLKRAIRTRRNITSKCSQLSTNEPQLPPLMDQPEPPPRTPSPPKNEFPTINTTSLKQLLSQNVTNQMSQREPPPPKPLKTRPTSPTQASRPVASTPMVRPVVHTLSHTHQPSKAQIVVHKAHPVRPPTHLLAGL